MMAGVNVLSYTLHANLEILYLLTTPDSRVCVCDMLSYKTSEKVQMHRHPTVEEDESSVEVAQISGYAETLPTG